MAYGGSTQQYQVYGRRPELPPICPPDDIKDQRHASMLRQYMNWWFRYRTTKRAELERSWNRARLYDAGRQWNQPYRRAGTGDRYWFDWQPLRAVTRADLFPRPVRNHYSAHIQDEVSRLYGVGRKPYIRVDDPEKEDGAITAKQVLLDRNEKTDWDRQQRIGAYHCAMFGQWIHESYLEFNRAKRTEAPPTGAVHCPDCEFTLVSPLVEAGDMAEFPGAAMRHELRPGSEVTGNPEYDDIVESCPMCGAPLQPWEEIPRDRWMDGEDSLGRPLKQKQPVADDLTSNVSPYDFFPDNQGVGYTSACDMEAWGIRQPRSTAWVKARYQNAQGIRTLPDVEAFAHHPILVSYGMGHFTASSDGIWEGWGMVDRVCIRPCEEYENGRLMVMWGDRLLQDDELLFEGTDIPRYEIEVAQWELRENEVWGKSLAEDMFSAQDNINATLSQEMNIFQKYTDPKILLHAGQDLKFKGGSDSPYASDVWTINNQGVPPEIAARFPQFIGEKTPSPSLSNRQKLDVQYLETASGARAPEIGNVTGVELNYSALLFASQRSAQRREPRVKGIRNLNRALWKHRLRLVAAFWREDRLIHYRNDSDKWAVKQVRGFMLQDQTDVALEDEPMVDSAIALRASITQAREMGTIKTSAEGGSYGADRRINRALGVPDELNEDRDQQEDYACREWRAWLDDDYEPVIDQQNDDQRIHVSRHALDFEGRTGQELRDQLYSEHGLQWGKDVLLPTWEWQRLLGDLQNMRAAVNQARGMEPAKLMEAGVPPEEIQKTLDKVERFRLNLLGFPPSLELQIYNVWKRLLTATGNSRLMIPNTSSLVWTLHKLVRFKAHLLAHVLLAAGYQQPGVAPQPQIQQLPGELPGLPPGGPGPAMGGVPPAQASALQQGAYGAQAAAAGAPPSPTGAGA